MLSPSPAFDDLPPAYRVAHPVVHLREGPSNGAERVTQALLGHLVFAHREQDGWAWVETEDTYRGWCDLRWLRPNQSEDFVRIGVSALFCDVRSAPDDRAPLLSRLSLLSQVRVFHSDEDDPAPDGWRTVLLPRTDLPGDETGYVHAADLGSAHYPMPEEVGAQAARCADEFRGTPYVWGGSSAWGLDCSGLVQMCYRLAGITLRRDADIQRDDTRFVAVAQEDLQPGDLVFFGKPDRITHVGMHRAPGEFIHSAGGAGVIVTPWGDDRYSPGYVDARRLDPERAFDQITRFESETR